MPKMMDTEDDAVTPPDPAEDFGQTLLEQFMGEALMMVVDAAQDTKRSRETLHPMATRCLFNATKGITNIDLLNIVKSGTSNAEVGDKKQARLLRSPGKERGLSLGTLQRHAVALLFSAKVPKAEIARAWASMLIFDAAREAYQDARKTNGLFSVQELQANPKLANDLLNRCYDLVGLRITEGFGRATAKAENSPGITLGTALAIRFLQYGAAAIVEAMDRPVPLTSAYMDLDTVVYPEIEAYDLEAREQ